MKVPFGQTATLKEVAAMTAEEAAWTLLKLVEQSVSGTTETRRYQPLQFVLPLLDTEAFWRHFPRDEPDFRAYVISPGIALTGNLAPNTTAEGLLPSPPSGYYWASNTGGLISGPNQRTFRLWYREPPNYGPPGAE